MSQFFTSGGQNIGASASASVPPMNIQDSFPSGWTGWISLLSKGFSRVFSNTTVQRHQFFGKIPWRRGRLPTQLSWPGEFHGLYSLCGEGNGTLLQYSCLENPMDRGAWWAAVHGVTKSWTRLSDFTCTFHFHALEKEMATHSSVLAWRIPGAGEPGGPPSMGSHRVGHD